MKNVMAMACCLACMCAISCSKPDAGENPAASATAAMPDQPSITPGGSTDPAYDWEKSTGLNDGRRFAPNTFQSSKTLEQTTQWLRWALERYGHTHPTIYSDDISNVSFRGCNMEWTERQTPDNAGVTSVARRSVSLADISLERGAVSFDSDGVSFRVGGNGVAVVHRYFENGKEKPTNGEAEKEEGTRIPIQEKDKIGARIAFALVHAAQLCGAQPQVER